MAPNEHRIAELEAENARRLAVIEHREAERQKAERRKQQELEAKKRLKARLHEGQMEAMFLRQSITAARIAASLKVAEPVQAPMRLRLLTPVGNGRRASERLVMIAALPNRPRVKLTSKGRFSEEGWLNREISRREAEIKALRWSIYIGQRNTDELKRRRIGV